MCTKEQAISLVVSNKGEFKDEFKDWLEENFAIFQCFEQRALNIAKVRPFYSARTIAEHIRYETDLREISGSFKLNNNAVPDMSRLFSLLHPELKNLFRKRATAARARLRSAANATHSAMAA